MRHVAKWRMQSRHAHGFLPVIGPGSSSGADGTRLCDLSMRSYVTADDLRTLRQADVPFRVREADRKLTHYLVS
jgi:hypothetical protein